MTPITDIFLLRRLHQWLDRDDVRRLLFCIAVCVVFGALVSVDNIAHVLTGLTFVAWVATTRFIHLRR